MDRPLLVRLFAAGEVQCERVLECESCQEHPPMLRPPAPPFAEIAQRPDTTEASLTKFIATTHRGLDNPGRHAQPRPCRLSGERGRGLYFEFAEVSGGGRG